MYHDQERIIIRSGDREDIFFKQKEQEQIKALREKAQKECTEKYCTEHKYHCFRCGTQSLVQIQKGKCIVDICINDNCGAIHLDAGELEAMLEDKTLIKDIRKSVFDIFKK